MPDFIHWQVKKRSARGKSGKTDKFTRSKRERLVMEG
jgi:hypothetical protein